PSRPSPRRAAPVWSISRDGSRRRGSIAARSSARRWDAGRLSRRPSSYSAEVARHTELRLTNGCDSSLSTVQTPSHVPGKEILSVPREGGCACGAVRYRLTSDPLFTHCCHCLNCQRQTGSAFVINLLIETD